VRKFGVGGAVASATVAPVILGQPAFSLELLFTIHNFASAAAGPPLCPALYPAPCPLAAAATYLSPCLARAFIVINDSSAALSLSIPLGPYSPSYRICIAEPNSQWFQRATTAVPLLLPPLLPPLTPQSSAAPK
jgi:hypothetical protein